MLFSLGGMFQHLWSLPISMSLTRPNHRTNNQVCSTLIPHTHTSHTHTQYTDTHTNNTCIPRFTHTHMQHMYTTLHTHTGTIQRHTTHAFHTHTDTHTEHVYTLYTHTRTHAQTGSSLRTGTLSFLFRYPSPCLRQGLAPGRYPTAAPGSFFPGLPDWSQVPSCVLYVTLLIAIWVFALEQESCQFPAHDPQCLLIST